jgi:hypothetical protein
MISQRNDHTIDGGREADLESQIMW